MAKADGQWRAECTPIGTWVIARYTADLGKPLRELHRDISGAPVRYGMDEQEAAEEFASHLNSDGENEQAPPDLTPAQRAKLREVADWPEGMVARSLSRTLLALEHYGLVSSAAEPNTRGMDRWKITTDGRALIETNETERKD